AITIFSSCSGKKLTPINGTKKKLATKMTTAPPKVMILWFKDQFRTPLYNLASLLGLWTFFSTAPFDCASRRFLNKECAKSGTIVIATSKDADNANTTANANGKNISPTCPLTSPNGKKTATVTTVEEKI